MERTDANHREEVKGEWTEKGGRCGKVCVCICVCVLFGGRGSRIGIYIVRRAQRVTRMHCFNSTSAREIAAKRAGRGEVVGCLIIARNTFSNIAIGLLGVGI